jgi:hypothetical protein
MKKLFINIIIVVAYLPFISIAQTIKIAKDGLVNVDGQDKFYLIKENAVLGVGDFKWQNLNHQDIGFIKFMPDNFNPYTNRSGSAYQLVMTQSGNSCLIDQFNSFSFHKSLARELCNAGILNNGQVIADKERTFIIAHFGQYQPKVVYTNNNNSYNSQIETNNNTINPTESFNDDALVIKNNKIFYQQKKRVDYTSVVSEKSTIITFLNSNNIAINIATYIKGSDEWEIINVESNRTEKILYNELEPLHYLVKFCIMHHYF